MASEEISPLLAKGAVTNEKISKRDAGILRSLAARVRELASREVEREKRDLWYRHNALEPTRPLIFCDPEDNGWKEIITPDRMECSGELARNWEWRLRKEIFWGESMGDDRVTEPFFNIPCVFTETDWGLREEKIGGERGGAYRWDAPVKNLRDLSGLRNPQITVDRAKTEHLLNLAQDIFGDLLTVREHRTWWWSLGMTWTLALLRGLEQIMYDMIDDPVGLHRLMAFLRDAHLAKLDFLEKHNLLSLNNDGDYVGSGGFGYTRELPRPDSDGEHVRTRDMWGFCESQETALVSPAMFEEFVFQYQLPILDRFGLNCYGCCEALDKRWEVVRKTPRLRRVSVSAWASLSNMAEKLGSSYIFSMKPNPADLAAPHFDENRIRRNMREALAVARDCRVEVIMKDNHTIANDPQRVTKWVRIVRAEAERLC